MYKLEPNKFITSADKIPVRSLKFADEKITNDIESVNKIEVLLLRCLWLSKFF